MHDFCFTLPYGLLLLFGGFMGYVTKGSIASLAGGAGTGLILIIAGYISMKDFNKRKKSVIPSIIQTACAIVLTYVMGQRYARTSKIMPAGLVAGISVVMTVFYLYKIATGGNKIPPKTE